MSADELSAAAPEHRPPDHQVSRFDQVIDLIRHIIADWGRTLRVALLISIPFVAVGAAGYGLVRLAVDPGEWWKPVACAIAVYVTTRAGRIVSRRVRKTGSRRR